MKVPVELVPLGRRLEVDSGAALRDMLFDCGVEFPCGGKGRCRGCRIRVLEGDVRITPEMRRALSPAELDAGWRLACHAAAHGPLRLDIAQWEMEILGDGATAGSGREGLGIAVDVGTTTVVVQLVDLVTGQVIGTRSALNPQCAHGADVMSRVQFALRSDALTGMIRAGVGAMVADIAAGQEADVRQVVLAGNTVMHHLFCGIDAAPLTAVPFRPTELGQVEYRPAELGWNLAEGCRVRFLCGIGGFVGSDILAGIAAVRVGHSDELTALIDLGTNGEIVVGDSERIECASTAAGPAFEAACISAGMRASTGAISEVWPEGSRFGCSVIGRGKARGICGSGLVDAAAAALENGRLSASGRLAISAPSLELCDGVVLTQRDLRELQLAKAAIAAGLRILCHRRGARVEDLARVYLAGAFGNYVRIASATRIGLLEMNPERVEPSGNTALRGAKMALFDDAPLKSIRADHVELAAQPGFQDTFVDCMVFPEVACSVEG